MCVSSGIRATPTGAPIQDRGVRLKSVQVRQSRRNCLSICGSRDGCRHRVVVSSSRTGYLELRKIHICPVQIVDIVG